LKCAALTVDACSLSASRQTQCGGKLHFKAPTGRFEGSPLAACGRRGPGESPGDRRSSSERSTRTHTHLHALTYTWHRYCRRSTCSHACTARAGVARVAGKAARTLEVRQVVGDVRSCRPHAHRPGHGPRPTVTHTHIYRCRWERKCSHRHLPARNRSCVGPGVDCRSFTGLGPG
jgi:predicted small lipoprotein YifL